MSDTLKQLGKSIGSTQRAVEFLNRRGGYLPQLERTRGSLQAANSFIANFHIAQPVRRVGLKITFYKASIL